MNLPNRNASIRVTLCLALLILSAIFFAASFKAASVKPPQPRSSSAEGRGRRGDLSDASVFTRLRRDNPARQTNTPLLQPTLGFRLHDVRTGQAGSAGHHSSAPASITVTNINDNGPGSLRQALADAIDNDTIGFDPALNGQTISLTTGELVIDKDITITGPGPGLLTITEIFIPKFLYRILHVQPGHTVSIAGLTITGGYATGIV